MSHGSTKREAIDVLSCKEVNCLASKSLDERLSWRERVGLRMHLLFCRLCRRYVRDLRFLRLVLRRAGEDGLLRYTPTGKLSSASRERIKRALSEAERRD
jgi:hypothetical protein